MKKLFAVLLVSLGFFSSGFSQVSDQELDLMVSILKSEVKVIFAQNIELTTAQNAPFWEIYDAYEKEMKPISQERIKLLKSVIQEDDTLAPEELDKKIMAFSKVQDKRNALRLKYYKILKKKVGVSVAAHFYQLDSYVSTQITASLNQEIPLVKSK